MIEFLREFAVKPGSHSLFELAFGPGGAWSRVFDRAEGFRGATVLRDTEHPERMLLCEVWDSAELRDAARDAQKPAVDELEAAFTACCDSARDLGRFRFLSACSVKPRARARSARRR